MAGIGDTLARVYAEADSEGIPTAEAAERLAGQRLEVGRTTDAAR